MKHFFRAVSFSLYLLFTLCTTLPAAAQTHTPKYVSMGGRARAYYEYLPEGYNPGGTATYPLLVFLTGIGEFYKAPTDTALTKVLRNGVPKLIQAGTFPKSFTVNGKTHRFIIITPQFVFSPAPTAADIEEVLDYVVSHYKVDTRRIYLTGLSYGGGLCFAYAGNNAAYASRVAAIVPTANPLPDGGNATIYARSRVIAADNVAVWATHNSGDRYPDSSLNTTTYVNNINAAPAPYPAAKETIFTASGHDSWTKTYDPAFKETNVNVYEWMLQYQRSLQPVVKRIQVNVYGGTNSYTNATWNNWNVGTAAATNVSTTAAFKYTDGSTSTVTGTLSDTRGISDNGSSYYSGIAPAAVERYTSYGTALRTLTIKGLSTSKTYNLEFYASRNATSAANTVFKINSDSVIINAGKNYTNKAAFTNVKPNASGQIIVSINKSATYNYLNGFILTESTSTRFVKTTIYGGTNPYTNTQWNNWNVGTAAATNKSITTLKYSDGTTSSMTATLSDTKVLNDNASTYGSGMAPAEVLRYTSSSAVQRTLIIGGLSTAKTYAVELYAGRAYSGAASTIFTVGSTSATVNAVNNLTSKAVFYSLKPNTSGQIIVTIKGSATNNYLNGFVVMENGINWATTSAAMASSAAPLERNPTTATVTLFPNPASDFIWLALNNAYKGTVQVQIADAGGRLQKTWRFEKSSTAMQHPLPVMNLPKGIYFVTVQLGSEQQTIPFSKIK